MYCPHYTHYFPQQCFAVCSGLSLVLPSVHTAPAFDFFYQKASDIRKTQSLVLTTVTRQILKPANPLKQVWRILPLQSAWFTVLVQTAQQKVLDECGQNLSLIKFSTNLDLCYTKDMCQRHVYDSMYTSCIFLWWVITFIKQIHKCIYFKQTHMWSQ
jgi:hypothetical protein